MSKLTEAFFVDVSIYLSPPSVSENTKTPKSSWALGLPPMNSIGNYI